MLLIALLLACPAVDRCIEAAEVDATMVPGSGEKTFTPIEDGDVLSVNYGAQGGSHVWVGVATTGVDPGRRTLGGSGPGPAISWLLTGVSANGDEDDAGSGNSQRAVMKGDPSQAELSGQFLFLSYSEVVFDHYRMDVSLEDACGTQLSTSRTVSLDL